MASRKQTPDVLGEILGGESQVPQVTPAPKPQAPPKRSRTARKSTRQSRPKHASWEYMEVVFRDYGGYRPRYVNGKEKKGWKQAPLIHEYLNQLGEEGWEVAGVGGRHNDEMPVYCKRLRS
jgi:hypothetical protein